MPPGDKGSIRLSCAPDCPSSRHWLRSCVMTSSPSIVPEISERDIYLVLDDFGSLLGLAWRETGDDDTERAALISNLLDGQDRNPTRIIAFNMTEGWSRDVSEDLADELSPPISTARPVLLRSNRLWFAEFRPYPDRVSNAIIEQRRRPPCDGPWRRLANASGWGGYASLWRGRTSIAATRTQRSRSRRCSRCVLRGTRGWCPIACAERYDAGRLRRA